MSTNRGEEDQRADVTFKLSRLSGNGWQIDRDTKFVTKTFAFENWTKCLNFAQLVEIDSWSNDHHALLKLARHQAPEKAYFVATVRWVTYKNMPPRVSMRDIESAQRTDTHAATTKALVGVPNALTQVRVPADAETAGCLQYGWMHDDDRMTKKFYFATYTKCRDFVHLVGIESKTRTYHPEITYFPCWVQIRWPLILNKDVLAVTRFCDATAMKLGISTNTSEGNHACIENL